MAAGEAPKALAAAPQGIRGMGRLAFGVFLFGIVIPFPLWIVSERAGEAGFMLSALVMLLALVLECITPYSAMPVLETSRTFVVERRLRDKV
jgi:hypothetical protein